MNHIAIAVRIVAAVHEYQPGDTMLEPLIQTKKF